MIEGRKLLAEALFRREINALAGSQSCAPSFSMAGGLAPQNAPAEVISVAGVVRPLAEGRFGIGDPASERVVEVEGILPAATRGSPAILSGCWDAKQKRLKDAALIKLGPPFDYYSAQTIVERLGAILGLAQRQSAPAPGPQGHTAHNRAHEILPEDEFARILRVVEILETEYSHHNLSLSALSQIHALLASAPTFPGGKFRDGPAVVRLDGRTTFLPLPAADARVGTVNFIRILAEHLSTGDRRVHPAVLAAESFARFTDLHPFQDGNGRVARAVATWLLLRSGYQLRPELPLADFCNRHRRECFRALRRHECDPWAWHQFFFDAVLTCFIPPRVNVEY